MEFAQPRQPRRTHVNLNQVIENSLRLVSVDKQFKQLKVAHKPHSSLPSIDVDQDQMQQVSESVSECARRDAGWRRTGRDNKIRLEVE